MKTYKNRSEVPDKYKWDLTEFYQNEKEFLKELEECQKEILKIHNYRDCTKSAKKLFAFLELSESIDIISSNLYVYAYLKNDEELGNSKAMSNKERVENLINDYELSTSFFAPALLKLTDEEYKNLYIQERKLAKYQKLLDKIYREKKHILDEEQENIISELDNAANHFEDMSSTMLNSEHDYGKVKLNGEEIVIAPTNLSRLMKNENRSFRKKVREKYSKTLGQYASSSAQFLQGHVKSSIVDARLHNFKNPLDAKLFHLNMEPAAYQALVNTVESHLDSLQKYYKVFKKNLGFKDLYQYDLNLSMANNQKEYSIEEAQELILKAISPLGEDYKNHFQRIFDNRYVDYCQYPKKCSGGYSFSTLNKNSRILMSFNYNLDSVSTLAHEGGHNVHHQYVMENNTPVYTEVPSIMAEVASLTNECLLSSYLASNGSTKDEKLSGIENILNVIISNLFGAVREAEMEKEFYSYVEKGNTITKDYMNKLTLDSLKKYYGNEVKLDEYSAYSWIRRSHYYMNFYLYNYAFCISIASYIAKEILSGNQNMLKNYLKYLSLGSNNWPKEAFNVLEIDLKDKTVYEGAIKYFDEMLNKFESIKNGSEENGK